MLPVKYSDYHIAINGFEAAIHHEQITGFNT